MPKYKDFNFGGWDISHVKLGFDHGYFTEVWMVKDMPVLTKFNKEKKEWESWMSLYPHEIESQEIPCNYAFGNTVIMGLGMGWVAINFAMRNEVNTVIVIERDPNVIEVFHKSEALLSIPEKNRNKIKIIREDALFWKPEIQVDFLYADIWLYIGKERNLKETRIMQSNVKAKKLYFWGQELTIFAAMKKLYGDDGKCDKAFLNICKEDLFKIPLLIPDNIDYAELVNRAATLRLKRGMKIDPYEGIL